MSLLAQEMKSFFDHVRPIMKGASEKRIHRCVGRGQGMQLREKGGGARRLAGSQGF